MFLHAHKCLHCAGIEPATSCVVGEYSYHNAQSAVKLSLIVFIGDACAFRVETIFTCLYYTTVTNYAFTYLKKQWKLLVIQKTLNN
jgi:hypothetical protein